MISNRSLPTDTLLPHIFYHDVAEAITWLAKTLGFSEHYRYGEPGGPVSGAQMHLGNAWIMLKRTQAGIASPAQLGYGTQSLSVFLEDVDTHFQNAKSAGAQIVEDLHETVYGERQYGVEDLAGHHWLFSQHVRDLSPDEWGATVSQPAITTPQISPMLAVSDGNAAIEFYKQKITIAPMLSVRNGMKAIEFYKAALGAEELYRVDEGGAVVAQLSIGESEFWLADESPEHLNFSPESLGGGSVRMIMIVNDPDAAFQRAIAAGATVVRVVEDQPYGWRVGRIVDPFGHHWEIGKPLSASF
jgi:uncharacterized glyoxalase superfamily protein PhnB